MADGHVGDFKMPKLKLINNIECPLCNCIDYEVRKQGVRFAEDVDVCKCQSCSLEYLWPQPDNEHLNEFYTHEYRTVYGDPTPAERHVADTIEANQRIKRLSPNLDKKMRVLEIGSGSCAFIQNLSPLVDDVIGVEMDDTSREWFTSTSSIKVFHKLEDVPNNNGFDLIVLFHVLEHLSNPVKFLKELAERLNLGGSIVIEVPNVDDALLSLYKIEEFSEFYFSIAHLTYFNPKSLSFCANKAGLIGKINGIQRYDISNHINWALNRKPGGQGKFSLTVSEDTNHSYLEDLVSAGQTDTLWGVFGKI